MKIIVCCHKKSDIKKESYLLPIHVGKALSSSNFNMQGDDTGDNISIKNPNYCELTGLYWAWKNLKNEDYIGLCHYRRYFLIKDSMDIKRILGKNGYDMIVAQHRSRPYSIADEIISQLTKEDFVILEMVLKKKFPDKKSIIDKYFYKNNHYNPYNMFICNKKTLNSYCTWLFNLLFELEAYIRLSGYNRLRRIFGYLGEYLLSLYINMFHLKSKEIKVYNTEDKNSYFTDELKNKYFDLKYHFLNINKHSSYIDVRKGLENDGIIIK